MLKQRTGIDKIILMALFLAGITLPFLGSLFGAGQDNLSNMEKRRPAALPEIKFDIPALVEFPGRFDAYYNDHFGFRGVLVRLHNELKTRLLCVSPTGRVLLGKDGWLFYADEKVIDDYRNVTPFSEAELGLWRQSLEGKRDWLAERGIQYLFVIAPNKHSVYPEYLPDFVRKVRDASRSDQLVTYMREHTDIDILDLRPALLDAKQEMHAYHMTDSHWNAFGAYKGYARIIERVSVWFPEMKYISLGPENFTIVKRPGLDLAKMIGMPQVWGEGYVGVQLPKKRCSYRLKSTLDKKEPNNHKFFVTKCAGGKLRGLMFHDSFAQALVFYVSEHFSRICYAAAMPDFTTFKYFVEKEHPDVVIEERVERYLFRPPKTDERFFAATQRKKLH